MGPWKLECDSLFLAEKMQDEIDEEMCFSYNETAQRMPNSCARLTNAAMTYNISSSVAFVSLQCVECGTILVPDEDLGMLSNPYKKGSKGGEIFAEVDKLDNTTGITRKGQH